MAKIYETDIGKVTVRCNNHVRELVPLCDLPAKAAKDFDYIEGDDIYSPRLVRYKGAWYDTSDMMAVEHNRGAAQPDYFKGWHAYASDSYFSGILVRFVGEECDAVIIGDYYC